nr:hypothetical protein [Tanacetum cinerariifolium]
MEELFYWFIILTGNSFYKKLGRGKGDDATFITNGSHEVSIVTNGATDMLTKLLQFSCAMFLSLKWPVFGSLTG